MLFDEILYVAPTPYAYSLRSESAGMAVCMAHGAWAFLASTSRIEKPTTNYSQHMSNNLVFSSAELQEKNSGVVSEMKQTSDMSRP